MNEPDYENTRYNVYMTKPTPQARHSIGHEAKWLGVGMIMTIFDLSTFHGYTDSLQPYLDAVGGCGTETIGDEACDVIDVSYMDGQRTWRIWISTRNRLPRKLKETVRVRVPIEVEETWTNLSVDSDLPDHLFAWKPPEGWKEWRRQATETKLLEPGTPAREFELKLADGKTTRLSDHRGKVVLLVVWRSG